MTDSQQNQLSDEFTEWKSHPFTQRYFKYLFFRRERTKEDWAKSDYVGVDMQDWALKNAKALGGVDVFEELLQLDMEQILTLEKEAHEYVRNQSRWLDGAG